MLSKLFRKVGDFFKRNKRYFWWATGLILGSMAISLAIGKIYQGWDDDPQRGAIPISDGAFDESYSTPQYLAQGWSESDSLWFYNTTQGSALIPYDLFLVLEQADTEALFRADHNMDSYRYLPQKPTFFNPDGLPVGFTQDTYQGHDYIGFTCAACHTGQINYQGQAIRIDGGPAMADMVGFLEGLEASLMATLEQEAKRQRFVDAVLALDNDYASEQAVLDDLETWSHKIQQYNQVNQTEVTYGYGRLDAFGRIFNRVLEHVINRKQLETLLLTATDDQHRRLLTQAQVDKVLEGVNDTVVGTESFAAVFTRLGSDAAGYPNLDQDGLLTIREAIFNEPNAPVSYPFLWDIPHSDYVQWNGLASNADVGPLGRNAGEVIGVFAMLDWHEKDPGFSLAGLLSGQRKKHKQLDFQSSVNLTNLERLETHLKSLKSPEWPQDILGEIDQEQARRGELIYAQYCLSCHELVDREAWDRIVIGKMSDVDIIGTDPAMAKNSIGYKGKSGNFQFTYQTTSVGPVIVEETAPAALILTAATKGVVATPDADKWWIRRWLDWLYLLGLSFFDNDISPSVKAGNYKPDTTAQPFNSLLAYKGRSLNGIWATAPYLHNGSVPSLYDLLLPAQRDGDPEEGEYRPDRFMVGSREFDPVKVGFRSEGYEGFLFEADQLGDWNHGHEYGAGRTPQPDGEILPALNEQQRWDLVEYLKTL